VVWRAWGLTRICFLELMEGGLSNVMYSPSIFSISRVPLIWLTVWLYETNLKTNPVLDPSDIMSSVCCLPQPLCLRCIWRTSGVLEDNFGFGHSPDPNLDRSGRSGRYVALGMGGCNSLQRSCPLLLNRRGSCSLVGVRRDFRVLVPHWSPVPAQLDVPQRASEQCLSLLEWRPSSCLDCQEPLFTSE
jgi:hypothetical protein